MMDWDTYATLLNEEQKERAEKGLPPLFGENQQELLAKENRQKMISAIKILQSICENNRHNIHCCNTCPFGIYCTRPLGIPIPANWTEYIQNKEGVLNE